VPICSVGAVELAQIHLCDGVNHKPREVPLGQPIADIRRQEERMITVSGEEVVTLV
jgi:hypothetical protein